MQQNYKKKKKYVRSSASERVKKKLRQYLTEKNFKDFKNSCFVSGFNGNKNVWSIHTIRCIVVLNVLFTFSCKNSIHLYTLRVIKLFQCQKQKKKKKKKRISFGI